LISNIIDKSDNSFVISIIDNMILICTPLYNIYVHMLVFCTKTETVLQEGKTKATIKVNNKITVKEEINKSTTVTACS